MPRDGLRKRLPRAVGEFAIEHLREARDIRNEVAEQPVADRAVEGRIKDAPVLNSCVASDWQSTPPTRWWNRAVDTA